MVEVPRDERHVEVTGLADGLAVVERLEHREQARVLLNVTRQRVEVPGSAVPAQLPPTVLRRLGCRDRRIDVLRRALRHLRELVAVPWVQCRESLARLGEAAAYEVTEAPAVTLEPGFSDLG